MNCDFERNFELRASRGVCEGLMGVSDEAEPRVYRCEGRRRVLPGVDVFPFTRIDRLGVHVDGIAPLRNIW